MSSAPVITESRPVAGDRRTAWTFVGWVIEGLVVVALMYIGLVHERDISPLYHVGSFDDDASYIMGARAIAHGGGPTTILTSGYPLVGAYPPGFSAILSPLAFLGGNDVGHYRALATVMYLLLFPLTWLYLRRKGLSVWATTAVGVLLALSPVAATFATMVMAETTFLVVLLIFLLVLDRWEHDAAVLTWAGIATVVLAEALVWIKEASAGLVIGLVVWLLLRRARGKALLVAVGTAILFLPIVITRLLLGISIIGSRYSTDYAGAYNGGLVARIIHLVPRSIGLYLSDAFTDALVPVHVSPLPAHGVADLLFGIVQWTTAPLVILGAVIWARRGYGRAVITMTIVYLLETLVYPFINERRVILVLPLFLAWYVLGLGAVGRWILVKASAAGRWAVASSGLGLCAAGFGLIIAPLSVQFPRDYLLVVHQPTSFPQGSPYMNILSTLGRPSDVVETSYLWTTALYTGHRTAKGAFGVTCPANENNPTTLPNGVGSTDALLEHALEEDRASYLLLAALNKYGNLGSPCLTELAAADPAHFVRILRTYLDDANVYELIGPGTPNPNLVDLTQSVPATASTPTLFFRSEGTLVAGAPPEIYPVAESNDGVVSFTWSWTKPAAVTQISMGAGGSVAGATPSLQIQLRTPSGTWRTMQSFPSGVGGRSTQFPYVLDQLGQPVRATAARVVVQGDGLVALHDFQVLGVPG